MINGEEMKLLFCISGLAAGGGEQQFVNLLQGFDKGPDTLRVHVFGNRKDVYYKEVHSLVSPVHYSEINPRKKWAAFFAFFRDLKKIVAEYKPDVIYARFFKVTVAVRMLRMMGLTNARIITSIRMDFKAQYPMAKLAEIALLPFSHMVVTNHKPTHDLIRKYFPNNVTYIPNGIETKMLLSRPLQIDFWKENTLKILCVGRLAIRSKKQDTLLKALDYLRKNAPHIRFKCIFIGEGKDKKKILSLIETLTLKEYVQLLPPVPDLRGYYQKADVLIHPSVAEGCPNVVLEAMLAGLPVIVSAYVGRLGIVQDRHNGLVTPSNDYKDFANKLMELYKFHEHEITIMKENAKKTVLQSFSCENMIDNYRELFQKIVTPS